jgi:RNA polymerase sigma factor (sigma-70 family)
MQRYRWLMAWALRLTEHDRQQAEDLVHDTFVHFIISRPSLERIQENIDGYLYTMLKNMHLSEVRRTARIRDAVTPIMDFSLTDYDSVESGLRVLEEMTSAQVYAQIRDQLRRLCHYACVRKNSSKAGSVLLLRFFHGYYPEEISRVSRTSRQAVEDRLRRARKEARVFLEDPASLSFMGGRVSSPPSQPIIGNTTEDFMEELRREIYGSRNGACLSRKEIERLYNKPESLSIGQEPLSHFVSCADCLDTVNRVLGLPLLADRFPITTMSKDTRKQGKDGGDGPGSAPSGGIGGDDLLKKVRRKAQYLLNQRPLELRISVNGFILGSQSISSRVSRQTITVKGEERIGFVEIFSEREVRLLFSCVELPPDGPIEHKERVALSDGRSLQLVLDFSNSTPDLHVVYTDPVLGTEPVVQGYDAEGAATLSETLGPQGQTESGKLKPLRRAMDRFELAADWRFWLRPGMVTALLALIVISALLFVYRRAPIPALTAAHILQKSVAADEAIAAKHEQVLHRTVQLEEKSTTGQLIARRRIEIWQSADKGIIARRLYDEGGALVAGDWRRQDGVQTLYHHGTKPQLQLTPDKRKIESASFDLDQVWQFEPSAKDFRTLIGGADRVAIEDKGSVYVLNHEGPDQRSGIINATLTLNKADLHATELVLVVRDGSAQKSENGVPQLQQFRFTESAFERRTPSAVAPGAFEPDPEFLSDKPETRDSKPETVGPLPGHQPPIPVKATPELELETAYLLDQVKANLGEQISLIRTRGGTLRVDGIVETNERKTNILRALAPVASNPALAVSIVTTEEAVGMRLKGSQSQPFNSPAVQQIEPTAKAIPVDAELRRYFSGAGWSDDQLEANIYRFASRMVGHSSSALQHAWALKRLSARFSPDELHALSPEARAKWVAMMAAHAQELEHETSSLRQELAPIFFSGSVSADVPQEIEIRADEDLARASTRLVDLCTSHHNLIRAAFAISSGSSSAAAIRDAPFQRSLRSAEKLAAQISKQSAGTKQ